MNSRLIELALKGLEAERRSIDHEIQELQSQLGGGKPGLPTASARSEGDGTSTAKGRKQRGRLSAAGRKAISDAMKKRWAERRRNTKK